MPWTEITRPDYDRRGQRYASDTTDEEWALVAPFMPPASKVGRPRRTDMRAVWDAIQYMAASGCQWAMLPKDFPPFTTVQYYFYRMRDLGLLDVLNDALVGASRILAGRDAAPTAGIIPLGTLLCNALPGSGQPVGEDDRKRRPVRLRCGQENKGAEEAYPDRHRRQPARPRYACCGHSGSRRCARRHRAGPRELPTVSYVFADGGYSGEKLAGTLAAMDGPEIEIVKRPPGVTGFVVVARRWVVERTFACLGRCRRLAKDWEASVASADAWVFR